MTFNANQWYTERDLARAGIRNDQTLQLLVARDVVETQCDGYSELYLGKGLLLALDGGQLSEGESLQLSSKKRAAARPKARVARPSPTRLVASTKPQQRSQSVMTSRAAPAKARPEPRPPRE